MGGLGYVLELKLLIYITIKECKRERKSFFFFDFVVKKKRKE